MTRTRNDATGLILLLMGLVILGLLGASNLLGNCPTSASIDARLLEGAVVFLQLVMLGGMVLLAGLFATRNAGKRPRGKWWAIALGLLALGALTSGHLLRKFGTIAACTDGLFGWLPF